MTAHGTSEAVAERGKRTTPVHAACAIPRRIAAGALAAVVWLTAAAPAVAQDSDYDAIRSWVEAHQAPVVEELVTLLSIPNVASDLPNIRRNADLLVEMLEERGIEARLLETGGPPVVFGELNVPGASTTVLFYCHYDGQPVDPAAWVGHSPWEPVLREASLAEGAGIRPWPEGPEARYEDDWRIYARSASDDKSPIVGLLAAIDALRAQGLELTANVKFLFEGDEEIGSPHLPEALRAHADLLAADVAIFADGPVHPSGAPSVGMGVRGIVTAEITVYGPAQPLHSGHYGNWAPNPAERLIELLATTQDETGRVTIEGWYEDVVPLGPADSAALETLPDDPAELRELAIAEPEGEGRSRWEMVTLPSFNVRGIRSGWVGEEARTIVPDRAIASLDLRLVPDVRPRDQVELFIAHVRRQGYHVVSEEPDLETRLAHPRLAKVVSRDGYPAVRTPLDHPAARTLVGELRRAHAEELVVIPTYGGSIPGYLFPEVLGAAFVNLPIVNPDNNQHSPNENLRLGHFFEGIISLAAALRAPWEGELVP